jgi:uncharacterized Fe-S center protein
MTQARTPREAKQQLLDDLIEAWRKNPVTYTDDLTPKGMMEAMVAHNRRIVTEVAKKHRLTAPAFTPDFKTQL